MLQCNIKWELSFLQVKLIKKSNNGSNEDFIPVKFINYISIIVVKYIKCILYSAKSPIKDTHSGHNRQANVAFSNKLYLSQYVIVLNAKIV